MNKRTIFEIMEEFYHVIVIKLSVDADLPLHLLFGIFLLLEHIFADNFVSELMFGIDLSNTEDLSEAPSTKKTACVIFLVGLPVNDNTWQDRVRDRLGRPCVTPLPGQDGVMRACHLITCVWGLPDTLYSHSRYSQV